MSIIDSMNRPTITDVARKCGLSKTTVSVILNESAASLRVPPETQQRVRTAAFSLAFVTATAIFGGFTPAVSTLLIEATGNKAAPALWLSLAAAISLSAAILARRVSPNAGLQTAMA